MLLIGSLHPCGRSNGCLRCFHLAVRSVNVLQLHTRDPQASCATNLNATYRLCPTAAELSSEAERRRGRVHEIMMYSEWTDGPGGRLWRTKQPVGQPRVQCK